MDVVDAMGDKYVTRLLTSVREKKGSKVVQSLKRKLSQPPEILKTVN